MKNFNLEEYRVNKKLTIEPPQKAMIRILGKPNNKIKKLSNPMPEETIEVTLLSTAGLSMHDNSIIFLCYGNRGDGFEFFHRNESKIVRFC